MLKIGTLEKMQDSNITEIANMRDIDSFFVKMDIEKSL